jgi:predicted phosphoribosyltransferase
MGAVVDGGAPIIVRNDDVIRMAGVNDADFKAICDSELAEIERRHQRYIGTRKQRPHSGHCRGGNWNPPFGALDLRQCVGDAVP